MDLEVKRFDIWLVDLDLTVSSEIHKTQPCLIISPDEMNDHVTTVIVALMTTRSRVYPTRVACRFGGQEGQIVLDQIRTVDKARLLQRMGRIHPTTQRRVLTALAELFAP